MATESIPEDQPKAETEVRVIHVRHGKKIITVPLVSSAPPTIGALKEALRLMIDSAEVTLVLSGKTLKDDAIEINSLPGGFNAKIVVIGAKHVASSADEYRAETRVIDDLNNPVDYIGSKKRKMHVSNRKYGFHALQTLPNLRDEERARQILIDLAEDEGILAVMEKHHWQVGQLCEMFPEGQVGVSDVCVMGLNENHGQRILLRLRTDDLKGFRKFLSIKKVLHHELAHNVHSDHNDDFYRLMREIEKEATLLDWKHTKGKSLVDSSHNEIDGYYYPRGAPVHRKAFEGGVHRLGSSADQSGESLQQLLPAKILAGSAAIMRLTEEEKEVEDHCGCVSPPGDVKDQSADSKTTTLITKEHNEETNCSGTVVEDVVPSEEQRKATTPEKADIYEMIIESTNHVQIDSMTDEAPVTDRRDIQIEDIRANVLLSVDEFIALALSFDSTVTPVEKLIQIRDLLEALFSPKSSNHEIIGNIMHALRLLLKIITNAKDKDDPKYKSVKKSNKTFISTIGQMGSANDILLAAGFSDTGESLTLKRYDPALLYIVHGLLDVASRAAEQYIQ